MKKLILLPVLLVTFFCLAQDAKKIIGKPIKIDHLLFAQNDFPKAMNWDDANKACKALGEGWRLATKDELKLLYDKIGGFVDNIYWSSTERDDNLAWFQSFSLGDQNYSSKGANYYVRAIRAF